MCPLLASMLAQFLCHMQTAKVNNLKAHYTKAAGMALLAVTKQFAQYEKRASNSDNGTSTP
jgi:hypothetical protein